jgi:hypothetical protein
MTTLRRGTAIAVPFLLLTLVTAQEWEPIPTDLHNVRGINYIPTYRSLTEATRMPPGFRDVASPVAMWRFYDRDPQGTAGEVAEQLDWIKGLGLNAVRVWLSFPVWYADRGLSQNRMVDNFAHFLSLCEDRQLYVVPVLFDAHCYGADPCTEPDYQDPLGEAPPHRNIGHWAPSPGPTLLE